MAPTPKTGVDKLGLTATAPPRRAAAPTKAPLPDVAINVPIPADLHKRLRIKAITENTNLKEAVIDAIEAWVA